MRILKRGLLVATLALPLAAQPPAGQADESGGKDEAFEMAEDAMLQLMLALQLMISAIPQYEMPEVLDNGDIIIRRKQPAVDGDTNDDGVPEEET